jgi:hypothetical protein
LFQQPKKTARVNCTPRVGHQSNSWGVFFSGLLLFLKVTRSDAAELRGLQVFAYRGVQLLGGERCDFFI